MSNPMRVYASMPCSRSGTAIMTWSIRVSTLAPPSAVCYTASPPSAAPRRPSGSLNQPLVQSAERGGMRVHGSGKNVSPLRDTARRFGLPVAALFCGLGLAGCERAADGPAAAPAPVSFPTASSTIRTEVTVPLDSPQAAQLKIEPVRIREIAVDEVTAPGRIGIDPNRTSRLLIPVAGRVVAVLAKVGDAVEQGQRGLDVDSPDADAAIAAAIQAEAAERQAQAALSKADGDLARTTELFEHHAVAQKDMLSAQNDRSQAQAALG